MRRFTPEDAVAALELEQMLTDYWREVDHHDARGATDFFSEDCIAEFGAITFKGHAGVQKYYADRAEAIRAQMAGGVRTTRHVYLGLRISFPETGRATLNFLVITFGGAGHPPLPNATLPVAISDSRFECRRDPDGQWRFFGFYGTPIFVGGEAFAANALLGEPK
jgi:hypothetical protein